MKRVFFVTRRDRLSAQRYLRIAEQLLRRGVMPVFVAVQDDVLPLLAEQQQQLGITAEALVSVELRAVNADVPSMVLDRNDRPPWLDDARYFSATAAQGAAAPNRRDSERSMPDAITDDEGALARRLDTLGFHAAKVVGQQLWRYLRRYAYADRPKAEAMVKQLQPAGVIYDIEAVPQTLALLIVCREQGIPIFSLQHAGGYGEQYQRIPLCADYYFAYSPYNHDAIRRMGVEPSRILLTGLPEPRVGSAAAAGRNLRARWVTDGVCRAGQTAVLIALKPCRKPLFAPWHAANVGLLRAAIDTLGNDPGFCLLARVHPQDRQLAADAAPSWQALLAPFAIDISFAANERTIEENIAASDVLITFDSTCIVDALAVGVPTCSVIDEHGPNWPPWHKHGAYRRVATGGVVDVLRDLKNKRWPIDDLVAPTRRQRFVDEFVPRRDAGNAAIIAEAIAARIG